MRGVLGVGRRESRPYGPRDSDVLEAFAALASLAIRNAETFSRSARQARVQRGFYRIAAVLGQSLSRAATLDAVAQAAAEALGGAAAAALMPAGGGLALSGSHDLPPALVELFAAGPVRGAEALVRSASNERVIASPNLADDERVAPEWRAAAAQAGFGALLSVPVVSPRDGAGGLVAVFFEDATPSATTTSSSPGTSPAPPAVRSSAASCTRRNAARVLSLSSWRAPEGCSRPSSILRRCSTKSSTRRQSS